MFGKPTGVTSAQRKNKSASGNVKFENAEVGVSRNKLTLSKSNYCVTKIGMHNPIIGIFTGKMGIVFLI